jgi:hypothetical protein
MKGKFFEMERVDTGSSENVAFRRFATCFHLLKWHKRVFCAQNNMLFPILPFKKHCPFFIVLGISRESVTKTI